MTPDLSDFDGWRRTLRRLAGRVVRAPRASPAFVELSANDIDQRILARSPHHVEVRRYMHEFVKANAQHLKNCRGRRTTGDAVRIFFYWDRGLSKAPEMVSTCYRQLVATQTGATIIILDDTNIRDYVDLPDAVYDRLAEDKTHFSDILRVALLAAHGGVWTDATCYHVSDLRKLFLELTPSGFFAFSRADERVMGNWFMMARPGAMIPTLMREALQLYWLEHREAKDYFFFNFLFEALYNQFPAFTEQWDRTPRLSADEPHNIQLRFNAPFDRDELNRMLALCLVHKLTYKCDNIIPGSLLDYLCKR